MRREDALETADGPIPSTRPAHHPSASGSRIRLNYHKKRTGHYSAGSFTNDTKLFFRSLEASSQALYSAVSVSTRKSS